MNKKTFILILLAVCLLSLNVAVAHELDNSTCDDLSVSEEPVFEVSDNVSVLTASKEVTYIDIESNTTFDSIGEYFKVKLTDNENNTIKNVKITFTVNGKTYTRSTDSSGIASLQLRLADGTYKIVSKYAGNSQYYACSKTSTIIMNNTRVVDSGLSSSEIQKIIDDAKVNNVILFKGKSYSNVNLVISKRLTLISNVDTTLKSSSSGPVITIKGKDASLTTVKGFNIQGSGDGIVVTDSDYITIYNNDITTKGNGIVATGANYLNITKNNIVGNTKSGITLASSSNVHIYKNKINENGENGVILAKSNKVYIYDNTINKNNNGIYATTKVNGIDYGEASKNVYITDNDVSSNKKDGLHVTNLGNNINVKSNIFTSNGENGIYLAKIGSNSIMSNVITDNRDNGLKFADSYVKPSKQDISYNVIYSNIHKDVEAKDTYYQENGVRLDLGDNWYGDFGFVCPKIRTNNMRFTVTQIGSNVFQALFTDSNGNIASLLPDRTLTYQANGQTVSVTISGGAGTFTVDGVNNGDLVKATVDMSRRDNVYDSDSSSSKPITGTTPNYVYPNIPNYQLYEDIGTGGSGNGDGSGEGSQGNANAGRGNVNKQTSEFTGNGSTSQNTDPSSNQANQANTADSTNSESSTSEASASESSNADGIDSGGSTSNSVVKQIIIDEDDVFRVTGISFIVVLIILTIGFYYREDIKEMNSKR